MEKLKKLSREELKNVTGGTVRVGGCQSNADCGTGYECHPGMYGGDNYCVTSYRDQLPTEI